jgi:amino acid transporter
MDLHYLLSFFLLLPHEELEAHSIGPDQSVRALLGSPSSGLVSWSCSLVGQAEMEKKFVRLHLGGGWHNALASQALMPLLGMEPNEGTARVITLVVLVIQAALAIASTRIVAMVNGTAVGLELVIVVVLAVALLLAVAVTGNGSIGNLISRGITVNDPDYFAVVGGLMLAMVMGLTTLVGFDAAANLAEEAKDPYRSVPRAIVGSVVAASLLGLVFLIALTVAIDDISRVSASESPVVLIMHDQLGPVMERTLLVAITFAFFGAGMVTLTSCSRIVFAMARDARFPVYGLMRQDDPHRRSRSRPDGRATRWRTTGADNDRDDHRTHS